MEIKKELKIYQVDYSCESCKKNVRQVMTEEDEAGKAVFIHECPNCSSQFKLGARYPFLSYE